MKVSSLSKAAAPALSWCSKFTRLNIPTLSSKEVTLSNIYLRDNSQSTGSLNPTSQQRLHLIKDIDLQVHPVDVRLTDDASGFKVIWSDSDESSYGFDWIRENVLKTELRSNIRKEPWSTREMSREKVSLDYKDVLSNTEALRKCYETIWKYGLCILRGSPLEPRGVVDVSRLIGDIKSSREYAEADSSGERYFELNSREDKAHFDLGYSDKPLGMHTDNSDLELPAGVISLQVVKQAERGGDSVFADCIKAADILRAEDPTAFHILTTWPVVNRFHGSVGISPVIELHSTSSASILTGHTDVKRVKFCELSRSPWQPMIPQTDMPQWYRALKKFGLLVNSDRMQVLLEYSRFSRHFWSPAI
ncbi:uncharacterized protein LOC134854080 isoform X2 [Symsagittifera roscoffensis]|uniref:uncharacterized protein LOC134854080 isoform X2 n=1 Tax=Symsagittifera roscoffensis TaxID=84072 RepID=UPI00307C3F33